jgi:hypothetical protein
MGAMAIRMFVSLVVAGALLTPAAASDQGTPDQVTLYLTNGDSVSGDRAISAEPTRAMPQGGLLLGAGPASRAFGADVVALIAWVTAPPPADELKSLPNDGHTVVLRNGTSQHGRMLRLEAQTLHWRTARGAAEQIRLADVARVYLNPGRARAMFAAKAAATAPGPDRWGARRSGEVSVPGNQPWTDTGLDVRAGDRIQFVATGQIRLSINRTHISGPGGAGATRNSNNPLPTAPVGALIARIGDATPFLIGLGRTPLAMANAGRLYLGINDDDTRDNSGSFEVKIERH